MHITLLIRYLFLMFFFFFHDPATTEIYTLSLHDALPISSLALQISLRGAERAEELLQARERIVALARWPKRSEEHTSELQSRFDLVCRLLLEKKKKKRTQTFLNNTLISSHTTRHTAYYSL